MPKKASKKGNIKGSRKGSIKESRKGSKKSRRQHGGEAPEQTQGPHVRQAVVEMPDTPFDQWNPSLQNERMHTIGNELKSLVNDIVEQTNISRSVAVDIVKRACSQLQ